MRITADGRVGIGTDQPAATLDVAGTVRVSQGLKFADGTTMDATSGKLLVRDPAGEVLSAGTGTINRLAKWAETGGAGTLTDAAAAEVSGLTIFGQNSSAALAPLFPAAPNYHVLEVGAPGTKTPLVLAGGSSSMEFWRDLGGGTGAPMAAGAFGMAKPGTAATNDVVFSTYASGQPWNERMRITNDGNVGIGNPAPGAKLDVAGNINTSTQYDIGGNRVLTVTATSNTFAGIGAGTSSTGDNNSFFGRNAGGALTNSGSANSFFGERAGAANTTGFSNSFFGKSAGLMNTVGKNNSFFGNSAGQSNTAGAHNSFFGDAAGPNNTTAGDNSFFGYQAGYSTKEGANNSFFGTNAGFQNYDGASNSYFGKDAGVSNLHGANNSFFGADAGRNSTGSSNSFFGAEAGYSNELGIRNAFFGRSAGRASVSGNDNTFVGYVAGDSSTGSDNTFVGSDAGGATTSGVGNTFSGSDAGDANTEGNSNTFIGKDAGNTNTTGSANTVLGYGADVGSSGLLFATAIGANAVVNNNNSVVLGRAADTVRIPGDLIVTGSVSKGGGSFKIDHPLDPANKTLSHSFVESPDMMNVYNGNITTNARGLAVVTLPNYFEALNRDFRYQLTVIGKFAQAIVLDEIDGNRFRIKTSRPRVKVSWQVTGIRQDAYANARRIPTEELKPEPERGTYLHPDAFAPQVKSHRQD